MIEVLNSSVCVYLFWDLQFQRILILKTRRNMILILSSVEKVDKITWLFLQLSG